MQVINLLDIQQIQAIDTLKKLIQSQLKDKTQARLLRIYMLLMVPFFLFNYKSLIKAYKSCIYIQTIFKESINQKQ